MGQLELYRLKSWDGILGALRLSDETSCCMVERAGEDDLVAAHPSAVIGRDRVEEATEEIPDEDT